MQNDVVVRVASAEDKDAILAFCQNTFSWGDYIHEVWDYWLTDNQGKIFVGVVDDVPIGMMHVAFLRDGAAWMEGMRVHPAYRRAGVASAMDAVGRAYARERGYELARLATGMDNLAAQKTLENQGYHRTAQYGEWSAPPARGKILAITDDTEKILSQWRGVRCTLIANPEWRWEKLDDVKMVRLVQRGEIRANAHGIAILREMVGAAGLILHALVGADDAMYALARAARAEANYRGYPRIEAMILSDPKINRALERAGFKRDGGMFIYEQVL